jgi:hypothetical protein
MTEPLPRPAIKYGANALVEAPPIAMLGSLGWDLHSSRRQRNVLMRFGPWRPCVIILDQFLESFGCTPEPGRDD